MNNQIEKILNRLRILIIKKEDCKIRNIFDRELSEKLGLSKDQLASYKHRESEKIFSPIIEYCLKNEFDLNYVFRDGRE